MKHWTIGARYPRKLSADGSTLSAGRRPTGHERKTPGNAYDVVMTRVQPWRGAFGYPNWVRHAP